jgi:four helix bundle protein
MSTAQRFEDLECWQCARELVNMVYKASRDGSLAKDYGLKDQIRRACVSVMNILAEGFTRYGRKEMIRFFNISQSSASEVQSMTYILSDLEYLPTEKCREINRKALECRNKTIAFMRYHKDKL